MVNHVGLQYFKHIFRHLGMRIEATDYTIRKKRREERRAKLVQLLGGKCVACGSKKDLHFDHKNKRTKTMDIAHSIDTKEDLLVKEVKKCQLLCKPCHIKKTRDSWDYAKPPSQHGTLHHYRNHGCRCDKCREAVSKYYHSKKISRVAALYEELLKKA